MSNLKKVTLVKWWQQFKPGSNLTPPPCTTFIIIIFNYTILSGQTQGQAADQGTKNTLQLFLLFDSCLQSPNTAALMAVPLFSLQIG